MRTLAVDLGARRVGLALSDAGGTYASPHEVVQVVTPEQASTAVLKIVQREGVERLVVGLPLNMDGSAGPAARETAKWAAELGRAANLPVICVDERLSSFAAEQRLADRKRAGEKLTRQRKKERLDAVAAAGFLQEFLDGRLTPIPLDDLR